MLDSHDMLTGSRKNAWPNLSAQTIHLRNDRMKREEKSSRKLTLATKPPGKAEKASIAIVLSDGPTSREEKSSRNLDPSTKPSGKAEKTNSVQEV